LHRRGAPYALYRIPLAGRRAEIVEDGLATSRAAATKTSLYFVSDKDRSLYRLPFRGGPARKLGPLPMPSGDPSHVLAGFTVSPDDTKIVWATREQQHDLMLIRGFQ